LGGNTIHLSQVTNYPWEGNVTINVTPEAAGMFDLLLRVPGWAQNRPVPGDLYSYLNARKSNVVLKLNGNTVTYTINDKGYIVLSKIWQAGDKVELSFPMDVHRTIANANVAEDKGKVSLERGPIVYAMEWADNDGHVFNGVVADNDSITTSYQPDKLTGIVSLQIAGKITSSDSRTKTTYTSGKQLTAIPYFAWDNRGIGEMAVWMARTPAYSKATPATDTLVYNVTVKPDFGTNNTNYPYTIVSADKQAVYNALGLQQSDIQSKLGSTVIYGAINPTGLINTTSTAGSPGHWFDKNGAVTVFNSNATVYSELDLANLAFRIGLRPGLSKEGDMFTIKQALTYTPDKPSHAPY
jgi:hypothetical protein